MYEMDSPCRLPDSNESRDTVAMLQLTDDFEIPVHRFMTGGYSLAYRDEGPALEGDSPPRHDLTILCVHGNPTWSYYYRNVFSRFSEHHRVVAVDHVGCGESEKPARGDFPYRLIDHQNNLADLIEHLDLRNVMLLAHDWGGAIGLGALLRCRERFSSIVLLNTAAFPPPYVPLRIAACRIPIIGTLGVRGLNLFARAAVSMAMSRSSLSDRAAAGLLRPYDTWSNRVAIDAFVRDIPLTKKSPTYKTLLELERQLPSLAEIPSLLVWGMKDWCFRPECLSRFREVWPDAEAVEISDAGHYVLEDATEDVLLSIERFIATRFGGECSD